MAFSFYRAITIDHTKVPTANQTNFPVLVRTPTGTVTTIGTAVTRITGTGDSFPSWLTSTGIMINGVVYGVASVTTGDALVLTSSAGTQAVPVVYSGFPFLATVANGGSVQNSSGFDIGFYSDSALTTKLDWEIELYTAANGVAVYWVRIASVSTSVDTVFYMAYGDASITTDQSNKTGVWDSNFKGVWHLNDNAANTTVADSTGVNNATNVANTSTKTTTGEIGSALTYNGTTDKSTGPDISSIDNAANATLEAWVYFNGMSDFMPIVAKTSSDQQQRFGLFLGGTGAGSQTGILAVTGNGSNTQFAATASLSLTTGVWYHIVVAFDGAGSTNADRAKIYLNGAPRSITDFGSGVPTTVANAADPLVLGSDTSSASFLNGRLDEVRISTLSRSADWILAEYNSQFSPSTFYAVGSQTASSSTPFTAPIINQPYRDQLKVVGY